MKCFAPERPLGRISGMIATARKKFRPALIHSGRTKKKRITDLREAQKYALDMENEARKHSDRVDDLEMELGEFKSLTKCRSVHDLRMTLDSAQGELITARELIKAVREKAPEVYAEVIQ